ncbi:aerolysin [Polycladomyces abyssicola]|uniref:Aerolysin n=1 Tax=Polycladomyces abyssicola TaxID=1125966 RepID=A0A8D5UHI6_9BACL|nr:S8 family peptidase [Polycladomyces abyssicola]BCU82566.1 aerolysin [Polycladomyces abyssicola]
MKMPEWFNSPPPYRHDPRQQRVRKIFYVRKWSDPRTLMRYFRQMGCRSFRFLPYLHMVIGEFVHDHPRESEHYLGLEYIEPDIKVTITDPYVGAVVSEQPYTVPWGVRQIEANRVWRISRGRAVRVAVIDTGIAHDHPAIRDNYQGGSNILSPIFSPYDYNGHGTHVAGTIAGRSNELGVLGVAPRAHLYAVKAFNRKGSANLSDLLSAINWCIENQMQVVNMSFGMDKASEALRHAIQMAHRRGIVMVAAAGNQGNRSMIDYPARYPETIAVTATGKNGQLASFSNLGEGTDLAAPGDKIRSAWLNNSTREMSGTSMSVPHVTGTVALMLYLRSELTPEQMRKILIQTCEPISGTELLGMVNAYRCVRVLAR